MTSLVDSHCHLNLLDLSEFNGDLHEVFRRATENNVQHMLCVSVELSDAPILAEIADNYSNVSMSVGAHPNSEELNLVTVDELIRLATSHSSCIALGETGLDYYRTLTDEAQKLQRESFKHHIHAAIASQKPLIIHTRQAAEDTLAVMREEGASEIGGVIHCFSEDWDIAKRALDLNFYISFSGIVTFKNATQLQEVAKRVPADRILIETDSPYLAPLPFRGKQNHPALVKHVALALSELRQVDFATLAQQTTANFYRCFKVAQ